MSTCNCGDSNIKCKEKCEDCTCSDDKLVDQDKIFDTQSLVEMVRDAEKDGGNLSYCYSNVRAPTLWMRKFLRELSIASKKLKNSKFVDIPRDINRFVQIYVNNTVLMSQDVTAGMFSVLEFVDLQNKMLEALGSFSRNHMLEIVKFSSDEMITWEMKILLMDCIAGDDFGKSSLIMGRKKQHE